MTSQTFFMLRHSGTDRMRSFAVTKSNLIFLDSMKQTFTSSGLRLFKDFKVYYFIMRLLPSPGEAQYLVSDLLRAYSRCMILFKKINKKQKLNSFFQPASSPGDALLTSAPITTPIFLLTHRETETVHKSNTNYLYFFAKHAF